MNECLKFLEKRARLNYVREESSTNTRTSVDNSMTASASTDKTSEETRAAKTLKLDTKSTTKHSKSKKIKKERKHKKQKKEKKSDKKSVDDTPRLHPGWSDVLNKSTSFRW